MVVTLRSVTPADVEGTRFGPVPLTIDRRRIAAYVAATGDDEKRWIDEAPPGYASVALFAVAPLLLFDPALDTWTRLLIHGDQQFTWHGALTVGDYEMTGTVDRVRMRGGTAFVTFTGKLESSSGVALESRSTFLMGTEAPPPAAEIVEPDVDARGSNEAVGERWVRSASRRDLVKYAAATGDFNPIHWDHGRAVAAGLAGIVCHGLLLTGWINQAALASVEGTTSLREARYRFKNPLRAAEEASLAATTDNDAVAVELTGDAGTVVAASLTVRT